MKIEFFEKNYKAQTKLKDLIEKKVNKFEKYLGENASCRVTLSSRNNNSFKMEVSVQADGLFVRSEVESDNMYANLDTCLSKIERQVVKHQGKLASFKRTNLIDAKDLLFFDELPTFKKTQITKRKKYDLYPISEQDAIELLELTDHDFYVFLNEKTQKVNIVYTRHDGDYGLIETDF